MNLTSFAAVELQSRPRLLNFEPPHFADVRNFPVHVDEPPLDVHALRSCAWEIGERRPMQHYAAPVNHAALAMVSPTQGFAYWKITTGWIDEIARKKGGHWNHCRKILRLYDVSYIEFNGLNANHIEDHALPAIDGQFFFELRRPGTWQLAEVGFLLRNGEFVAAARSQTVRFARSTADRAGDTSALLVTREGKKEHIGNVWEQERILRERRQPRLRHPLRIAVCGCAVQGGFLTQLAEAQRTHGHEVHLFAPAAECADAPGIHVHRLAIAASDSPVPQAHAFAAAVSERVAGLPRFDLLHLHEWTSSLVDVDYPVAKIVSITSIEPTRRNGAEASELSKEIENAECVALRDGNVLLAPEWLRHRAAQHLGLNAERVCSFPMHGRVCNEWDGPLDFGHVKMGVHIGPLDRMLLYVGSLEYAAGVDLIVEALPVLLQRSGNLRVVFAGAGSLHGQLHQRAHQLGVGHAMRLLGHVEQSSLTRLLRSAEALILPSRYRMPFDDAVVELARRAGRPVITTHAGPAHLVRHEENGLVTYDNPGSMVWAVDRILSDPGHAERMGQNGKRSDSSAPNWSEVANRYFEICSERLPQLTTPGEM